MDPVSVGPSFEENQKGKGVQLYRTCEHGTPHQLINLLRE